MSLRNFFEEFFICRKKLHFKFLKNKMFTVLALILLALPAVIYHAAFFDDGNRSWYYYSWNDASQMVAGQSVAQALGTPIEVVVWPGATLSTVYLYKSLAIPFKRGDTDKIQTAIDNLSKSVFFHWHLAFLYGLVFIWLIFFLVYKITSSHLLALGASCVIAINPWYVLQVTTIRPEMLSLLFLFAAALVAIKEDYKSNHNNKFVSISFGFFLAMAIFTKIQVVPVVIILIILFLINNAGNSSEDLHYFRTNWLNALIVIAALVVSFGFLKTELIIGSSYKLNKAPNMAGNILFLMSILLIVFSIYFINLKKYNRLANLSFGIFRIITGGLIALLFITLPNLLLGGIHSFVASINRILFGVISYGKYGEIWAGYEGWSNKTPLVEKLKGFIAFQYSSGIPFLNGKNLVLWIGLIILAGYLMYFIVCHIRKKMSQPYDSGMKADYLLYLPLLFFSIAILFDCIATFRKPGGHPYTFYHICSLPFYLIAVSTSLSLILTKITQIYKLKNIVLVKVIALVFFAGILIYYPIKSPKVIAWQKGEAKVEKYLKNIRILSSGVPSFFPRHGITHKDFVARLTSGSGNNKAK